MGRLHKGTVPRNVGGGNLSYLTYVPRQYDRRRREGFPVVYLLHGDDGSGGSLRRFRFVLDELIEQGKLVPLLAVEPMTGVRDDDADTYAGVENVVSLISAVDAAYHTQADRKGRFLVGFGAGGYDALRCALMYPQLFAAVTLLSPVSACGRRLDASAPCKTAGLPPGSTERTAVPLDALIEQYFSQPYRISIYIVAGHSVDAAPVAVTGERRDRCVCDMGMQAVNLYRDLHRQPAACNYRANERGESGSPAELRVFLNVRGLDVVTSGWKEGIRYMLGSGEERSDWSPVYDPTVYRTTRRGTVTSHRLRTFRAEGESMPGGDVLYQVYTPHYDFARGIRRFAVLYLLHGSGGTHASWDPFWPILDAMIEQKRIPPVIAVAPITGNSYWIDSERYGPVETALIRDLIPEIERTYSVVPGRAGRGLVGFSMGGFGALRYALLYSDMFGGAVLLSPALQDKEAPATSGAVSFGCFGSPFDPELWEKKNYPQALSVYREKGREVPLFVVAGDDDWNHALEPELPRDAAKYNMEAQVLSLFHNMCRAQAGEHVCSGGPCMELRIVNGGHTMHVWAYGFEQGIGYLFDVGALRSERENGAQ